MPPIPVNDSSLYTEAVVEALSTDGRGIVRVDGRAYFVAGGLPGDRLRLQLDSHTHPPSATIIETLQRSPQRVTHPCPHHAECHGSPWGALVYAEQLRHKRHLVERTLRKMIGEVVVQPMLPSPHVWQYRNRVAMHVWHHAEKIEAGFKTEARQSIGTAIHECHLASPMVAEGITAVTTALATIQVESELIVPLRLQVHETASGSGGLLVFAGAVSRKAVKTWEAVLPRDVLPGGLWFAAGTHAGIVDFRRPLLSTEHALPMQTTSLGHTVELEPTAFCQTNCAAAALVEQRIHEWAAEQNFQHVWDLYGGYGALGLAASGTTLPLTVFEISAASETAFQKLAREVGNSQIRFIQGDLLKTFANYSAEITSHDLLILDPPRSGAHADVLTAINQSQAHTMIYLSCNPARLARDMSLLHAGGFTPEFIQPYDFFPHTPAIETLVVLKR